MTRIKFTTCDCQALRMSDRKTCHVHFCDRHGGKEKSYFFQRKAENQNPCDDEPDDLSCDCKEEKFKRESKKQTTLPDIRPLTEAGMRTISGFIRMYPGTEITWKVHKKEWPIEIEAPGQLEYPFEKIVVENNLEKAETEFVRRLSFSDWGHLIWHIKHGLRPYKTTYDTSKQKWIPSEPLTLTSTDVI